MLILLVKNKKLEPYSNNNNPEIYESVPSYEPMWMNYNWAFYSPQRMYSGYFPYFGFYPNMTNHYAYSLNEESCFS